MKQLFLFLAVAISGFVARGQVDFSIENNQNAASLKWRTAQEQNVHAFVVQRSTTGVYYDSIATITPTGNNTNYHFTDNNPAPGVNYYRIYYTDATGRIVYSVVRSSNFYVEKNIQVKVGPNPILSKATVNIKSDVAAKGLLKVLNQQGSIVMQQDIYLTNGINSYTLTAENWPAGMYYVNVMFKDENVQIPVVRTRN
jgi:hypothetical protein